MFKKLFTSFIRKRSELVFSRISPYIKKNSKLLDIGSGSGDVAQVLRKQGFTVTPVDVADFHGPRVIEPVLYDGVTLPFKDHSFGTALLLMVMHHTPNPTQVFSEAARVAKEIVVIETSYTTALHRWFTVISDVLGNLRLDAQWNSYKTDGEWKEFFKQQGFTVVATKKYWDRNFVIIPFLHIAYHVKRL